MMKRSRDVDASQESHGDVGQRSPSVPATTPCNFWNCTKPGVWLVQFGWNLKLIVCDDDAKRLKGKKELAEHESPAT